ncbi:hypothetical protein T484DRAFT_1824822 [Baffinella frigidus]|nr:hypothetical protein T484DRAFT_1824822 [Cryptophyta sp. CCMP2293]
MPAAALLLVALSLSSLVDLTAPSSLMRAPAEGGRCRQVGAQVGEARETRGEACVFDSPSHTRREMLRLRGGKEAQDAFGKKGLEKLKKFFEEEEPTMTDTWEEAWGGNVTDALEWVEQGHRGVPMDNH